MFDEEHGCGCGSIPTKDVIACLCELKNTICRIRDCIGDKAFSKDSIVTCIILGEIKRIQQILTNEKFGLPEIKKEVRNIEHILTILNNTISNQITGDLNEIIAGINDIINNPKFGINEIKNEIISIESTVNNSNFGLKEIKNEIRHIENFLENFDFNITIEINFPDEIINGINDVVNNELFGLNEIKNEVRFIETAVTPPRTLTTGPVITATGASNLKVKVLNNTPSNQTVTIKVFDLAECPKCNNAIFNTLGPIPPSCTFETGNIDLNPPGKGSINEYEVEVSNLVPGVYVWSSAFTGTDPKNSIAINTFRHADFVAQIYNIC